MSGSPLRTRMSGGARAPSQSGGEAKVGVEAEGAGKEKGWG